MSVSVSCTADGFTVERSSQPIEDSPPFAVKVLWGAKGRQKYYNAVINEPYPAKHIPGKKPTETYLVIFEVCDDGTLFTQKAPVHGSKIELLPAATAEDCAKECGFTYASRVQVRDYTSLVGEDKQKCYPGVLLKAVIATACKIRDECGPLLYLVQVKKDRFWCRKDCISALPETGYSSTMPPPQHKGGRNNHPPNCECLRKRSRELQGSEIEGSSTTPRPKTQKKSVTKRDILDIIAQEKIAIPAVETMEQVDAVQARHEALIQIFDSCKKRKVDFIDISKFFPSERKWINSQLHSRWRQAKKYKMKLARQYEIDTILASFFQNESDLATCETNPENWQTNHEWINLPVTRTFEGVDHIGKITGWLPANEAAPDEEPELFHVLHSDGDEEDLDLDEVKQALMRSSPNAFRWWLGLESHHGQEVTCNDAIGTFHYAVDDALPNKQGWKISVGGELLSGHNFEVHSGCKSKNPKKSIRFKETGLTLDATAAPHKVQPVSIPAKKRVPTPNPRSEPQKKRVCCDLELGGAAIELRFVLSKLSSTFASTAFGHNLEYFKQSLVADVQAAVEDSAAYYEIIERPCKCDLKELREWRKEVQEWPQQHGYVDFASNTDMGAEALQKFETTWGKFVKAKRDERKKEIEIEIKEKETARDQLLQRWHTDMKHAYTWGKLSASDHLKQQEIEIEGIEETIGEVRASIDDVGANFLDLVLKTCKDGCSPDAFDRFEGCWC